MMDWTNAGKGVEQLLELIDDYNYNRGGKPRFDLDRIVIRPTLRSDPGNGEVVAYSTTGKMFHYFINMTKYDLIADGV